MHVLCTYWECSNFVLSYLSNYLFFRTFPLKTFGFIIGGNIRYYTTLKCWNGPLNGQKGPKIDQMDSKKAVNTLGQKCEMLDKSLNLNMYQ